MELHLHSKAGVPLRTTKKQPRVNVRARLTLGGAAVKEHHVKELSGLQGMVAQFFFREESVEDYYTVDVALGRGSFAVVHKVRCTPVFSLLLSLLLSFSLSFFCFCCFLFLGREVESRQVSLTPFPSLCLRVCGSRTANSLRSSSLTRQS